jgi:hypothetical protein
MVRFLTAAEKYSSVCGSLQEADAHVRNMPAYRR